MAMRRNASILVIDDEEIMREILETLLTARATTSGSPRTARGARAGASLPFDAVIVDMMMPGLDGIATLDELKSWTRSCRSS